MSSYVKSTNFASKDSLASGNPLKIIKGTEFDTEFNNIATAIDTKADLASPALTGTPLVPTADVNTNTTQAASTAFVVAQIAEDAPTKTGTGASGTWAINVTGNAATATNPSSGGSFITSLNIGSQSVNYAGNAGTVTNVTTTQILNATAGASAGAVGTYAFLAYGGGALPANPGTTFAGSVLSYANASDNALWSGAPAGTWRLMGYLNGSDNGGRASLFLRIS